MQKRSQVDPKQVTKGKRVVFRMLHGARLGDVLEVKEQTVLTVALRNGMTLTIPVHSVERVLGD